MPSNRSKGVLLVAPVLPLDVRMIAGALDEAGALDTLVTRWCFTEHELAWGRRFGLPSSWAGRPTAPVSRARLRRVARADFRRVLARRGGGHRVAADDASFAVIDRVAASLVRASTTAVLGREDACARTFQAARALQKTCIYQLPTAWCGTVQRLVRREAAEFPEAFDRAEIEADFAPDRLVRKQAEMDAATHVLCPSQFVRRSALEAGVPASRLMTLSLGTDTSWPAPKADARRPVFLYVGQISARKGVHRVIRMWKRLGAHRTHRLRLVGDLRLPEPFVREHSGIFEHVPRMPRERLAAEYSQAQAFVFNALADGFGHVFAEAMICGAPVLATFNCGAPDLIRDGVEGRLYEFGDDAALGTVLEWALSHPRELAEMGALARLRALRWGWGEFSQAFLDWLRAIQNPAEPGID